jgi:hypothetical protein
VLPLGASLRGTSNLGVAGSSPAGRANFAKIFDNAYAYGRVDDVMTDETPYNPCSRKGEVRARIATMSMDEVNRGGLRGRSARTARP